MMGTLRRLRGTGLGFQPSGWIGIEPLCVAVADWLFWDHWPGLSLPLFCTTLFATASLSRPVRADRLSRAWLILAVFIIPAIEDLDVLSGLFALTGTSCAVGLLVNRGSVPWRRRISSTALRPISGIWRIAGDMTRRRRSERLRRKGFASNRTEWLSWVVPLAMLSLFAMLLALANPVIASWFTAVRLPVWPNLSLGRVAFWAMMGVMVWPFVRPRRSCFRTAALEPSRLETRPSLLPARIAMALFGGTALTRALVLCNLLFVLQGTLDGVYLWGGMALPQGMSYAAYAHRGAYPLVATALLASVFVLLARQRMTERGAPRRLIALVLLFAGQNVLLVVSAMRRLELYVGAYGLTQWRLAALVWMGLVGIGLGLLMAQIAFGRSNAWLLARTMLVSVTLLYAWSLADVPALIASFNVAHSSDTDGTGPRLDVGAILDLGPDAVPAVDQVLAAGTGDWQRPILQRWRDAWACQVRKEAEDWRRWSVRAWRLKRYLDRMGESGSLPERCPDADALD